jgi:predicted outer membrane repeat protein
LTIDAVNLNHGYSSDNGGAITSLGDNTVVNLADIQFNNNTAANSGGAIYNESTVNISGTTIFSNNISIDELIPNRLVDNSDKSRMWGDIEYKDQPWVFNLSRPLKITRGLQNRHLSLWASHGRYYNVNSKKWEWQRPNLFCTCEDLFTQTTVVPYLIPMLQNAGAIVFTPRERDWQKNEVIVDNDNPQKYYMETGWKNKWSDTEIKGFVYRNGTYNDGENPFQNGTARMAAAVSRKSGTCGISYTPNIPVSGKYAVYVSYQTLPNSIPDAEYIVWHQGEKTVFKVNQTMGGSTPGHSRRRYGRGPV